MSTGEACVAGLAPAAKLVYAVVEHEGPVTQADLVAATGLSRSTVRRSAAALADCGVLTARPSTRDPRYVVYRAA